MKPLNQQQKFKPYRDQPLTGEEGESGGL